MTNGGFDWLSWQQQLTLAQKAKQMREIVEIYVPEGYANAKEFIRDCGFEQVDRSPAWDASWNRSYEPVETRAKEIYDGFIYDGPGKKPAWTPGGNGIKQDEARHMARKELHTAGHTP